MALNNDNNYIKVLSENAFDAHKNLYIAEFSGGKLTDSYHEALTVRCDGITPPATNQEAYSVTFMNQTIQRPKARVEVTRNFSIRFRVDANYSVFKVLLEQQNITFNPATSYTSTHIPEDGFEVSIKAASAGMDDTTPKFEELFHFKRCWISKIDPLSYKSDSSDPLSVNITINFIDLQDIHSGLTFGD